MSVDSSVYDINIIDSDERRVGGWASVEILDRQNDIVQVSELKEAMLKLMDRGGNIFYGHKNVPIGKILQWEVKEHSGRSMPGVYLIVKINSGYEIDDLVWKAIKEKKLKGFSIGGKGMPEKGYSEEGGVKREVRYLKKLQLNEISLVDVPANQEALITQVSLAKCESCGTEKCSCGVKSIDEKINNEHNIELKVESEGGLLKIVDNADNINIESTSDWVNTDEFKKRVNDIVKDHVEEWSRDWKITHADHKQDDRMHEDGSKIRRRQNELDNATTGGKSKSGKQGYRFDSTVIDTVMAHLDSLDQNVGGVKNMISNINLSVDLDSILREVDKSEEGSKIKNTYTAPDYKDTSDSHPFRCTTCGARVKNQRSTIDHHTRVHSPRSESSQYERSNTKFSQSTRDHFKSLDDLMEDINELDKSIQQMASSKPSAYRPYKCTTCGKKLANFKDAAQHKLGTSNVGSGFGTSHKVVGSPKGISEREANMGKGQS